MTHIKCETKDIALPEPTEYNNFIINVASVITKRSDQLNFTNKELSRSSDGVLIRLHQANSTPVIYSISFLPFKSGPITSIKIETLACDVPHCIDIEKTFPIEDINKVINVACEILEQEASGTFMSSARNAA